MLFLTGSWVAGGWCASVPRLQNAPDLSFNRVRSSLSVRVFLGLNRTATSNFRVLRQAERFLCHMERVKSMAWVPPVNQVYIDEPLQNPKLGLESETARQKPATHQKMRIRNWRGDSETGVWKLMRELGSNAAEKRASVAQS